MKREYVDYLDDLIAAMDKAMQFVSGMKYKDFVNDDKTAYAVIRAIEIIGEASKKIPSSIKIKYPGIPWKEMAGMRDKLIHEYFGVKLDIVWDTIKNEIPELHRQFIKITTDLKEK